MNIPSNSQSAPSSQHDSGVQFLLDEYDRLKGLEVSNWEMYHGRFNHFMTVALALMAAYVTLLTADPPLIPQTYPVPDLLVVVILVWGGFTFLGLTELSCGTLHFVRAMRDIQEYFTARSPYLKEHLYFDSPELYQAPSKIEHFASRWILGGSPKQILAVLDSSLIAIVLARFLLSFQLPTIVVIPCTIFAFVMAGWLHKVYVQFAYRRKYLRY